MGVITTTTIVHSVRAELRVSCDQYVIADAISYLSGLRKETSIQHLSLHLGMAEQDVQVACMYLVSYNIITGKGDGYVVTTKWRSAFGDDKLFDNPLPKFCNIPPPDYVPGFWQVYRRQGSSKPKALIYWSQVVKKVPAEKIIEAAKNYMESVSDPTYVMYAEKFLNPKTKYYESWLPQELANTGFGTPEVQKDMSAMI